VPVVQPDLAAVSPSQILVIGKDESVTKVDPFRVVAIEEPPPRKRASEKRAR
jgi:hypothetical protein